MQVLLLTFKDCVIWLAKRKWDINLFDGTAEHDFCLGTHQRLETPRGLRTLNIAWKRQVREAGKRGEGLLSYINCSPQKNDTATNPPSDKRGKKSPPAALQVSTFVRYHFLSTLLAENVHGIFSDANGGRGRISFGSCHAHLPSQCILTVRKSRFCVVNDYTNTESFL